MAKAATEAKKYTTNTKVIDQKITVAEKFKSKATNLVSNSSISKKELRKNKKKKFKNKDQSRVVSS